MWCIYLHSQPFPPPLCTYIFSAPCPASGLPFLAWLDSAVEHLHTLPTPTFRNHGFKIRVQSIPDNTVLWTGIHPPTCCTELGIMCGLLSVVVHLQVVFVRRWCRQLSSYLATPPARRPCRTPAVAAWWRAPPPRAPLHPPLPPPTSSTVPPPSCKISTPLIRQVWLFSNERANLFYYVK